MHHRHGSKTQILSRSAIKMMLNEQKCGLTHILTSSTHIMYLNCLKAKETKIADKPQNDANERRDGVENTASSVGQRNNGIRKVFLLLGDSQTFRGRWFIFSYSPSTPKAKSIPYFDFRASTLIWIPFGKM